MKTVTAFTLALALMLLGGCTSTPVASAQKAGIKTVHVEPRIDSQQAMRYGVDLSGGGLANLLAGMLVDSLGQKGVIRMSAVMQTNQIVVGDLVHAHAVSRLRQYPELQMIDGETDGVFVVKILQYGFDSPGLKLSTKVPFVVLRAELLNAKGKKIWSRQTGIDSLVSKNLGATWEEYEASPDLLMTNWNQQVANVVSHLFPVKK